MGKNIVFPFCSFGYDFIAFAIAMFLLVQYLSDEKIVTSRDIRQNVYVLLTELYILVLDLMLLSDFAIFRVEFA